MFAISLFIFLFMYYLLSFKRKVLIKNVKIIKFFPARYYSDNATLKRNKLQTTTVRKPSFHGAFSVQR